MVLFVVIISALIAVAAYKYNNWYIAQEQAHASIEDTPVLESAPLYGWDAINAEIQEQMRLSREDWANRLVHDIKAAQAEKEAPIHDRKVERLQFVIGSAEEKVEQERKAIYHLQDKLNSLNERMKAIDTSIEFYRLANKVDAEIAEQAKKEKLEDQIFSVKEKIRTRKEHISKAQFTRRQALAELDEIA